MKSQMPNTYNHNRDFKDTEIDHSGHAFFNVFANVRYRFWLLPLAIFATVALLPNSQQDEPTSHNNTVITERFDTSLAGNEKPQDENVTFVSDMPDTFKQQTPEINAAPILPEELAHTGSGISFAPLLKKSPELWNSSTVRKGDTLYVILKRLGLNTAAATLIARSDNSDQLVKLIPGRTLHILSNDGHIGDEYIYEDSPLTWVHAIRNNNNYEIVSNKLPTTTHVRKVKGEIISSLYASAKVAGISDTLTMNMTEIFGWDIDFAINVQPGDRFKLIFEDVYVNGSKRSHGDILAAEFINSGKTYRAIASRDEDGELRYYSPEGKSMQKAFLRTPVKFSRISSRFTKARYHPVLKKTRAHKGVDYAAGKGTPIRATAAGRVTHAGRKGGYGNAVIINHGSTYSTLYAHMSSYSRGIAKGTKVRQGQTIGYVGSTGLASGPHLHYEFRVNGKHVNPLTFQQPASKPIAQEQKADFERSARYWEEQLDSVDGLNIAVIADTSGS